MWAELPDAGDDIPDAREEAESQHFLSRHEDAEHISPAEAGEAEEDDGIGKDFCRIDEIETARKGAEQTDDRMRCEVERQRQGQRAHFIEGHAIIIPTMQVTRTYLELHTRGQFKDAFGAFPAIAIAHASKPLPELYRMCYRTVGEAFHWRDRWDWTNKEIAAHLADPANQLFVATRGSTKKKAKLAGWYELRRVAEDDSGEIAYFCIGAPQVGDGFGEQLLSTAVP